MSVPMESLNRFWSQSAKIRIRGEVGGLLHQQTLAATSFIQTKNRESLRIIGSATRRELENLFYPSSYAPRERQNRKGRSSVRRGSGAGRSSIFRGCAAEEFVVVPFERVPGEITALAMFDARPTGRAPSANGHAILMKSVESKRKRPLEGGLAMLTAVANSTPRFGDDIFAFLDMELGLRIQLKWTLTNPSFLPVVVSCDNEQFRTRAAWVQLVKQRKVIFICQRIDIPLMRQAWWARARIFVDRSLATSSEVPARLLTHARRSAKPWIKILRDEVNGRSASEVADYVSQLELPAQRQAAVLRALGIGADEVNADGRSKDR